MPLIEITAEERQVLRNHKNSSPFKLVVKKVDAILLAAQGADEVFIGEFVERQPATVKEWLTQWGSLRLSCLFTGHAGNLNASKLTVAQRDEVIKVLSTPPVDERGVPTRFWDVPTLANWVSTQFDVSYESPASYHLLLRLGGLSFHKPEPFDKRRDEALIGARMAQIATEITPLLADDGWEVFAADEVRIDQEAEIRRAWLPRGRKVAVKVDRQRHAQSFIGFLNQKTGHVELQRLTWQTGEEILSALTALTKRHEGKRIAIIWDNASWHKTKVVREQLAKGKTLQHVHLIAMPPYAPDHNPIEHVWGQTKNETANIQRDTFDNTIKAFEHYIATHNFPYRITHPSGS